MSRIILFAKHKIVLLPAFLLSFLVVALAVSSLTPSQAFAWCCYEFCSGDSLCLSCGGCEPCTGGEVCISSMTWECDGEYFVSSGECGPPGSCFAGETKIATPGGEKAISELKVGESVTSMDPETGELTESKVEDIYSRSVPGYYKVTVEMPNGTEKILKVTGEHPLYVKKGTSETAKPISNLLSRFKNWLGNFSH